MRDVVLELRNVAKVFGTHRAVDNISLSVERGKTVALLGASGSGKTTTLRMIAGFVSPDQGLIVISGHDMRRARPYERNVGLVFQDYALFPHLTVEQNVAYGLRRRGSSRDKIASRVQEMCNLVHLTGLETRRPTELSGGQQQRVALARAIAIEPELLLLDEPLSALDAKLRHQLRLELKQILKNTNCTSLIVTHDQEEAMSLADDVIVMHDGRILQEGKPTEVYCSPRSRIVAELIGRANWFEGKVVDKRGDCIVEFLSPEGRLLVAGNPSSLNCDWHVCIRPERMLLLDERGAPGNLNTITGTLRSVTVLGAEIHYVVELETGRTTMVVEHNRAQEIPGDGARVTIGFRPIDCTLVPSAQT